MEVFALELAVRETGAAQVAASTEKLRNAALKQSEAFTISARQGAKAATVIGALGDASASASIGAGALSTKLMQLGSTIGLTFGAASVAVTAVVVLGATFARVFSGIREETQKTVDLITESTRRMIDAVNEVSRAGLEGQREALRALREGQQFVGAPGADLTPGGLASRGLDRLRREQAAIEKQIAQRQQIVDGLNERVRRRGGAIATEQELAARRALPRLKEQQEAYARIVTELERIEATTLRLIAESERVEAAGLTVPGVGGLPGASTGATVAGSRFDEIVKNAQQQISQRFISRLAGFAKDSQEARALQAAMALSIQDTLAEGVTQGIIDGFTLGIERAIASGNIGEGFKAMTAQMLAGIGNAMIQFGSQSVIFGTLMERVKNALASLNGVAAIGAGVALIAGGAALKGVASRMFDGKGGAGGRGGFGSGSGGIGGLGTENVTRIVFGPTAAGVAAGMTPRAFNHFTIIGPNDPTAQRQLEEMITKATKRGGLG